MNGWMRCKGAARWRARPCEAPGCREWSRFADDAYFRLPSGRCGACPCMASAIEVGSLNDKSGPMNVHSLLGVVVLCLFGGTAAANSTLCRDGEVVAFSCSVGSKIVSLCATADLGRETGSLYY